MFNLLPPRPPGSSIFCCYLTSWSNLPPSLPPSLCPQMFLTVYLSNNDQHFTEVPVTPETLCRDVVELCKEPGEMDCHLSEMWRGSGEWRCQFTQCYLHPSAHTVNNMRFSVTRCFGIWLYPKGQESVDRHLFVLFLLIRGKLLFWSRPYMEISCVVNCLVISFWRAYLFLVCDANEAEPIIPVTNTSSQTSPTQVGAGGVEISCLPHFSPSLRVMRYSEPELKEPGFVAVSMVMLP